MVDNEAALDLIFSKVKMLIAIHAEDDEVIRKNIEHYKEKFGENIPVEFHPLIRSREACYNSSAKAIARAKNLEHVYIFFMFPLLRK